MFNSILDVEKNNMKFDSFYRGVVTETLDPKESGRIQIQVYPMFSDIVDKTTLPWAIVADSSFGGTANVGGINVPIIGSHVFVFFENGDFRFPVYFAGAPAIENDEPDVPTLSRKDDGTVAAINTAASKGVAKAAGGTWDEPDSAYAPVYPNNRVYRSEKGVVVEIDDTDGNVRLHVYHPSGSRFEIDDIGNSVEHIAATKTTVIITNDNKHVQGNQDTKVDGNQGDKVDGNKNTDVTGTEIEDVGSDRTITIGGNESMTITGTWVVNVTGNTTVVSPNVQVTGNVTTTGNVTLNDGGGGIITTQSTCIFSGTPHIDGSSSCTAKK